MAHLIPTTKPPRRGTRYSKEEITVISKYKSEYKDQTTRAMRANVLRNKILVDLFNHWDLQQMLPLDEVESMERVKELAAWVRNNWRPNATSTKSNPSMKIRAIDYVWETRTEAVEDELKTLLGVEELDHKDPRCFQKRNAAAKLALEKMSVEEIAEIELGLERRRAEGNPENIQRYRAERYRKKILQTFSRERWLDMGMSTITFTVHVDPQGRYIGDVHEDVLHNVGIGGRNFAEQHQAQVIEMTRKFLEYAKAARMEAADPDIADRRHTESEPIEIRMGREGFPIIPKLVMEKELKKTEWETLLRAFLTQQYYLASGKKSRHVPYRALKTDTASFINDEYRPPGITFQDPRNMHLEDIRKVLRHCYSRQAESGPESSFRFSLYFGPKRKRLFAIYDDPSHARQGPSDNNARKKKNKGKQREDPLGGLLRIDESVEPPAPKPPTGNHPGINTASAGVANPTHNISDQQTTSVSHEEDFVRIDMGQMIQLKEMGYEVMGPVNGPNEGYPEYEVRRPVFEVLKAHRGSQGLPSRIETDFASMSIDPSLLGHPDDGPAITSVLPDTAQAPLEAPNQMGPLQSTGTPNPQVLVASINPPPTVSNNNDDSANISTRPRTPTKQRGKRKQPIMSPQTVRQTGNTQKKKKITDDDRAAMEAENMVQEGSKRQRKPSRRR